MVNSKIAVIIPVYNGLYYTSKCLSGLNEIFKRIKNAETIFKIIVIDDGSTDGTSDWITENFSQTIILKGNGNFWWSGGINAGIRFALSNLQCNYIVWWNNDILCSPEYFSELIEIIGQASSDTIIGSKIYYANEPDKIWAFGGTFNTHNGNKTLTGMGETDSDKFQQVIEADWLPGMGTIIHKSVFERIGYVNEKDFPQYHGDSDFTFRAKLAGLKVKVFPQLKIWNDKSNSGIQHNNNFSLLLKSLRDVKSNYNFRKDLLFYRRYATSPIAYKTLILKYCFYIFGFIKWKFLSSIGILKKNQSG